MAFTRIAAFAGGPELFLTDASPNVVISPISLGALAIRNDAGNVSLWECTVLPSTWVDITPGGGGSGWIDAGTIVRLTTITDTVAVGATAMLALEKERIVLTDAILNAVSTVLVVEHEVAGVAAVGFGAGIDLVGENDAGTKLRMGGIDAFLEDATALNAAASLALSTFTTAGGMIRRWVVSSAGHLFPLTDNLIDIGLATAGRLRNVISNMFSAYANSGDANPTNRMTTAGYFSGVNSADALSVFWGAVAPNMLGMGTGDSFQTTSGEILVIENAGAAPRRVGGTTTRSVGPSAPIAGAEALLAGGADSAAAVSIHAGGSVRIRGLISVTAISGGANTAEVILRVGAVGLAGTLCFDTGARVVAVNDLIEFDAELMCRTTGAPGTLTGRMVYRVGAVDGATTLWSHDIAGSAAGTATVAFDTVAGGDFTLSGVTDAAGTTIRLEYVVFDWNA